MCAACVRFQFVEDAGPLAHPPRPEVYREINNFYTTTVYEKGAEVVRMLKVLLGPKAFRAGMDLYFTRHQCFADASGRDLTHFRRSRLGVPAHELGEIASARIGKTLHELLYRRA